jgi:hypothetical protein
VTLVCECRVEVAVGDDDLSGGKRRADHVTGVLGASGREEQSLRLRGEIHLSRVEQYVADPLGEGGSARLTSQEHVAPAGAEALGEASGLNRLPRGLSALKREEETAHR